MVLLNKRYKVAIFFSVLLCVQVVYFYKHRFRFNLLESSNATVPVIRVDILNRTSYLSKLHNTLISVDGFEYEVDCDSVTKNNTEAIMKAEKWSFNSSSSWMQFVHTSENKCKAVRSIFSFADKPLSEEELDYPLAYGMLVHREPTQVYFLLSALYQPQNQFCLAVDDGARKEFKADMDLLDECFPNIHVKYVNKIEWCGFSIVRAVFGCVKYLSALKSDWKYFQYLSGVDLPLKTNLEMVRIFKALNGSFNAEVARFQDSRLDRQDEKPPVQLWKSSLSATFSRKSADFMVQNEKVHEVYTYLSKTYCPDESFWTTIAGNPKEIPMPGGFDANNWYNHILKERRMLRSRAKFDDTVFSDMKIRNPHHYYISRQQTWSFGGDKCHGEFISASCAYGVRDLPGLLVRPELVAHKLYFDIQPAAYFCLYEGVRKRALLGEDEDFNAEAYSKLPGPRILAGDSVQDVRFEKIH